jgi:hypothetical protein
VLQAKIQWLVPQIAKWLYGEVWVLTDADIANYTKTLPRLGWTKDENKLLLAMTYDSLAQWYGNALRTYVGNWKDISWYEADYNSLISAANALKKELWVWTTNSTSVTKKINVKDRKKIYFK